MVETRLTSYGVKTCWFVFCCCCRLLGLNFRNPWEVALMPSLTSQIQPVRAGSYGSDSNRESWLSRLWDLLLYTCYSSLIQSFPIKLFQSKSFQLSPFQSEPFQYSPTQFNSFIFHKIKFNTFWSNPIQILSVKYFPILSQTIQTS